MNRQVDKQAVLQMAGGWPRLTKTPEGQQQKTSTTMTAEEQRAYDAAVAKASSWLSAAEEELQQQPPAQSFPVQDAHAQQYPQMEAQADEYALRLEQLRMAAAQASPAAAAPAADQQGRPVAGLQPLRQPSWGNDPSTSQQSSPQASRGPMSPALQWGATSSKTPPLGPKGYGTSPHQNAAPPLVEILHQPQGFRFLRISRHLRNLAPPCEHIWSCQVAILARQGYDEPSGFCH